MAVNESVIAASNGFSPTPKPPSARNIVPAHVANGRARRQANGSGKTSQAIENWLIRPKNKSASGAGVPESQNIGDAFSPDFTGIKLCYGEMIGWRGNSGYPVAIDFQFAKVQTMKLKRAAVYARKSGQRRDDSIAAQLKVIRRYARQRGLKIVGVATNGEA
jgi:hypothetical protein